MGNRTTTGWGHRDPARRDVERSADLARWVAAEVRPFSPWWAARLEGMRLDRLDDLAGVPVLTEAEAAAAGGPGNPGLLVLPTEDGFKRHADRAELMRLASELGGGGVEARRAALFRRYKPVHVHEAGVAALLAIVYTRTDLDRLHLAGARLTEVLGLGADDALVSVVPPGPSIRFWGLYHAALASRMTALHPRTGAEGVLPPALRGLALLPATVIAVPVEEALELLDELADRPGLPDLRTVLLVGPPPRPFVRAEIAEAAQRISPREVAVQSVWAPECARALWGEPRPPAGDPVASGGLHTYPDLEVLEVRDVATDTPVADGAPGELVFTSLGWRGTALLRLATGSWVAGLVQDEPCPLTGRTVPRIKAMAVDGAWQPRVDRGNGRRLRCDLRGVPAALEAAGIATAGVRDWSLREVDGRLVLGLDLEAEDRAIAQRLGAAVATATGVAPQVRLDPRAAAARPRLGRAGEEAA